MVHTITCKYQIFTQQSSASHQDFPIQNQENGCRQSDDESSDGSADMEDTMGTTRPTRMARLDRDSRFPSLCLCTLHLHLCFAEYFMHRAFHEVQTLLPLGCSRMTKLASATLRGC